MTTAFSHEPIRERQDPLERLDLTDHWGNYDIIVLRVHLMSFAPRKIIGFHRRGI